MKMPRQHLASETAMDLRCCLEAMAAELETARAAALDLQDCISALISAEACLANGEMARLQAADSLAQTLGDLRSFACALSAQVPAVGVDAAVLADGLHMRDVACRLSGRQQVVFSGPHEELWDQESSLP